MHTYINIHIYIYIHTIMWDRLGMLYKNKNKNPTRSTSLCYKAKLSMHTTHSNTRYKNESKHSEMGPVRQNPIQRTVSLFICVCIALCTIVVHNIAQNRLDSFPPYPPDNHHSSDDVYLREGGSTNIPLCIQNDTKQECSYCNMLIGSHT